MVFACVDHVPPAVFVMLSLCTAVEALHELVILFLHYKVVSCGLIIDTSFTSQGWVLGDEADVRITVAAIVF